MVNSAIRLPAMSFNFPFSRMEVDLLVDFRVMVGKASTTMWGTRTSHGAVCTYMRHTFPLLYPVRFPKAMGCGVRRDAELHKVGDIQNRPMR